MGREKYIDEDDAQPTAMCGGAVFNKFRPKPKETRVQETQNGFFKSFDQRPVMTESRSATSSGGSFDENLVGPETSLLDDNKSRSKRGSKLFMLKNFMNATGHVSSYENEEILRSEFHMEERDEKEVLQETRAVEFDPNDIHMLRGKHLRSMSGKSTCYELSPGSRSPSSPFPRPPKSPKSPKSRKEGVAPNLDLDGSDSQNLYLDEHTQPSDDIVIQQQEALKIFSSQNQYYRKKLGNTEKSYRKLVKNQMNQADVIDKLKSEKESFQAETIMLREEMKAVREQLDLFQQLLTQQTQWAKQEKNSTTGVPAQHNSTIATPEGKTPTNLGVSNARTPRSNTRPAKIDKNQPPQTFQPAKPERKNKDEQAVKAPCGPAESYWKREWELSINGTGEVDNNSSERDMDGDENSDPFFGISKDPVPTLPVRGVDPPEVKKPAQDATVAFKKPTTIDTQIAKKPEPVESKVSKNPSHDGHDYEEDIKYVHELMQKFNNTGSHDREMKKEPVTAQRFEEDLDESVFHIDDDKLIEIENMSDVDREYCQRQLEMARMRAAFESGDLDDSIQKTKKEDPSKSLKTRVDLMQPRHESKLDDTTRSQSVVLRYGKNAMPSVLENKEVKTGYPSPHNCHPTQPMMPGFLRGVRLQEPTVADPSKHRTRSVMTESRQDENPNERHDNDYRLDVSQHSTDTEYADHIDHSTSNHNALVWSQSIRSERSQPTRREASVHKEHSHASKPEPKAGNEPQPQTPARDLIDDAVEERSEHTLAEVRDPGKDGRKGATYKIKMSSVPSQRYQKDSPLITQSTTNHKPEEGHASPAYSQKQFSRRLI